jgi:hypothetical protein
MFISNNKKTYELLLSKLNENTLGVEFSGNYMFKMWQSPTGKYNFEIVKLDPNALEIEQARVVPVVDSQSIQLPFVEKNERNDFERELLIAIEVPSTTDVAGENVIEFDENTLEYQAILETIANMRSQLVFIEGDYKYTLKVKDPTKGNVFKYNSKWYQMVSITFYMSSIKKGYYGSETKVYFGLKNDLNFAETDDYLLDTFNFSPTATRTLRVNSDIDATEEKHKPNKRTWNATMIVNFTGNVADVLLQRELDAVVDMNTVYQIKVVKTQLGVDLNESYEYTRDVYVSTINASYENNKVDQFTLTIERA